MKRICFFIEKMYDVGGMERVLSVCANSLCEKYTLSIAIFNQKGKPYSFALNDTINLYDLGIKNYTKKEIKKTLSSFLIYHQFDIVVSMGGTDMYYLHSIKDKSKKIVWLHFAIDIFKTAWIGPHPSFKKKIIAQIQTWRRIYHAIQFDKIVVLTNADLIAWKRYTGKVERIYNPVTIKNSIASTRKMKRAISLGRLEYQKGYDFLVKAWAVVNKIHPDWYLDIYGDGSQKEELQQMINDLHISDKVTLCGRTSDVVKELQNHSIYVMSSRAEGMPLVLLEAASCALPLVSFSCPFGPDEIIENGVNGFLVSKVGDIATLADRICILIKNEKLRNWMGENALLKVSSFSVNKFENNWISLLNKM